MPISITEYVRSTSGKLKVVEMLLCLGGFISAITAHILFTPSGGISVYLSTLVGLVGVTAIFVLNTSMTDKQPRQFKVMVCVFYLLQTIFLLVTGVLSAILASQFFAAFSFFFLSPLMMYAECIAASAFFQLTAFLVFAIDTHLSLAAWRGSHVPVSEPRDVATTGYTTQTAVPNSQYKTEFSSS